MYRPGLHVLSLLVFFVFLAGCSNSETNQNQESDSNDGNITIEFWNGHTGPDGEVMAKLVKQFEEEHSDIKVNIQQLPWGELFTKAQLAANSNSGPDVVSLPMDRMLIYKDSLFKPIDDLVESSSINPERFDDDLWKATFFDDKQYAVPIDVHPYLLYYRPDLVEKAGLDPLPKDRPLTADEFLEYAKKLTTDDQKGFAFKQTAQHAWWDLYSVFIQSGGQLYDSEKKNGLFNSEETKNAINYLLELKNDLQVTPSSNLDWTAAFSQFNEGKAAMLLHGSWLIPELEASDTPYETAMVPNFVDGDYGAFANMHALALTRVDDEKTEASMKFIEWFQDGDHLYEWGIGSGNVPTQIEAREKYAEHDKLKPLAETVDLIQNNLFMAPYTEKDETIIYREIIPNLEAIYNDTMTVDEGVEAINNAITSQLQ